MSPRREEPGGPPVGGATAGPRLRGQLILARFDYLEEKGSSARESVLEALEEDDRGVLRGVERDGWYPFALLNRLDGAIARVVAPGDSGIFERLGAHSARHRTEWLGADARLYSVHGFLSRVADEHHEFHTFGRAVYHRGGFNEGVVVFSGYPEVYESFCQASVGYFRSAVESLSGGPVAVQETSCQGRGDPECRFSIRWGGAALSGVTPV